MSEWATNYYQRSRSIPSPHPLMPHRTGQPPFSASLGVCPHEKQIFAVAKGSPRCEWRTAGSCMSLSAFSTSHLTAISREKKKPRKKHSCTWQQAVVESSRCAQIAGSCGMDEWEIDGDWETEVLLDNLLFFPLYFCKNKPLPFPVRYAGLQGFAPPPCTPNGAV